MAMAFFFNSVQTLNRISCGKERRERLEKSLPLIHKVNHFFLRLRLQTIRDCLSNNDIVHVHVQVHGMMRPVKGGDDDDDDDDDSYFPFCSEKMHVISNFNLK